MNSGHLEFVVDSEDTGKRIDSFLSDNIDKITRSQVSRLIEQGKVKVNRQKTAKSYKLKTGDHIHVQDLKLEQQSNYTPEPISITVLHEDEYLMIVSKPADMVCHPGPGHSRHTLVNALLYHCQQLSETDNGTRPGIVHRLDKDTSGLIIIAKDNHTHYLLSDLFKKRQVKKIYWALVWGNFEEQKGTIALPLSRSSKDRKVFGVSPTRGKEACTNFEVVKQFNHCSWLSIDLETGRTHQIRVHMNFIGHPVLGDQTYHHKKSVELAESLGLKRQFLHAMKLDFIHPVYKSRLSIEDRLSPELQLVLDKLLLESKDK